MAATASSPTRKREGRPPAGPENRSDASAGSSPPRALQSMRVIEISVVCASIMSNWRRLVRHCIEAIERDIRMNALKRPGNVALIVLAALLPGGTVIAALILWIMRRRAPSRYHSARGADRPQDRGAVR